MKMLTARERLFAALNGGQCDRVPLWLLFPYHPVSYYVDVRTNPAYKPIFEESKKYAIMLNRRNFSVLSDGDFLSRTPMALPVFTKDVTFRNEQFEQDGWLIKRRHVEYKGDSIYDQVQRNERDVRIKKLLTTDQELEFFCSLPVETDTNVIEPVLEANLPQYLREKDEFPAQYGSMMLDLGEPIIPIYHNCDLEQYAIWSLTQADTIKDLLERLMVRLRYIYRWALEHDLADVYFLVGTELASPPLLSLTTFRNWIVPYDKELIDMIHSYGKKVIQHYHGQIREVLPDFAYMAPDAIHTIEAPPVGNTTFTQAYDVVKDKITLIGNLQYEDLCSFSKEQTRQAVIDILDECKGKRFILSPSAGPFSDPLPAQMAENYITMMQTAWDYELNSNSI